MIGACTPLIAGALSDQVPVVEDLDPTAQLIVDGTLLECWSWKDRPKLYSGKHRTTGLSVQVACTLSGALAWVCDPPRREGPRHRGAAPLWPERRPTSGPTRRSAATVACRRQGLHRTGMITPRRKPANLPLHPDDRTCNRAVNQIRYKTERVIANIKTWRVLHTGYRRPLDTFPETITAILGIIFTYTP